MVTNFHAKINSFQFALKDNLAGLILLFDFRIFVKFQKRICRDVELLAQYRPFISSFCCVCLNVTIEKLGNAN